MDNVQNKTNSFLGTEPLGKLMAKFTVPCIIALLVAALYNIVDQLFIANADYLGSYGLAANSVVYPVTVVGVGLAMWFGDGCCCFVSIHLGSKDYDNVHRSIGNAIICVTALGIILMSVLLLFKEPVLTLFGGAVNEQTLAYGKDYLTWIALGMPFYMFSQAMNSVIRADGSPRFSMIMLCAGALINVILDPVCIYALHWGMVGAAIATSFGQFVSAIMAAWYLTKRTKTVKLTASSFKIKPEIIKQMIPMGFPSFVAQISTVFSIWASLSMATVYGGKDPIFSQPEYSQIPAAVIGLTMKFFQIVISIAIGLATGVISIAGFNVGAKKYDRVRSLMWMLVRVEAIVGFVFSAIFLLFPNQIISIFGASNESVYYVEWAIKATRLYLCVLFFSCVNKGVSIYMQAMGDAKMAGFLSTFREIVMGVGLPLLLPIFMGLDGVLWFMCIGDCVTIILTVIVLIVKEKKLKNLFSIYKGGTSEARVQVLKSRSDSSL